MQSQKWSLQDAKNKLSAVVDAAQTGEAQIVTRRGTPAAVMVSMELFQQLQLQQKLSAPSFIEHLLSMPDEEEWLDKTELEPREVNFDEAL